MAMKLTAAEKATDSFIRQYNAQIEKAYRQLGANNTITRNLIHNARTMFGDVNMKTQKIKAGHLDYKTGEVMEIPQISRTRKALAKAGTFENKFSAISQLRNRTTYKTDKGYNYKSMFDVTRKRNEIVKKANAQLKNEFMRLNPTANMALKENQKKFKDFQRTGLTREVIHFETLVNDMQSEIFEAYEIAKEQGEDISEYQDFAFNYHENNGNQNINRITEMYERRNATLSSLTNSELTTNINNPALQEFNNYLRGL